MISSTEATKELEAFVPGPVQLDALVIQCVRHSSMAARITTPVVSTSDEKWRLLEVRMIQDEFRSSGLKLQGLDPVIRKNGPMLFRVGLDRDPRRR